MKTEFKHLVYGYHDADLRPGPVNFVATAELVQALVKDDRMVVDIVEFEGPKDKALRRIKRYLKGRDHPAAGEVQTVYGGRHRR